MPISPELKEVYASAPYDVNYIETLELQHPIFVENETIGANTGSVFLVNQRDPLTAKLEDGSDVVYEPAPFITIPPNSQESSAIQLQVAMDNTSRRLMDNLEHLSRYPNIPITVYYRVYLSDDLNTVANDPPLKLYVLSVTASDLAITFNAGLANLRRRPFPSVLYTIDQFAGLSR